ncbi:response regulator [Kaistella flava (ex Peng et al. 2021)]|uniref:Response regulator n=1 Tax=Kaistella flava (ex Peng et al. 2021) TaxID=2038776 RepID=A0A7M2YA32_9FLAO|nr:hypothetical protein [Kaistella flava (ex Peng et al. 2021)]QOW10282.1 response regulator [Kaistella flava (ex Peng et al. 2021)]
MKNLLIIEDDKIKIEKLEAALEGYNLDISESFHSGITALRNNTYDLVILDMTIPLWDRLSNDISQNYEQFGGEKILREMKRRFIEVPVILFTMFDKFPVGCEIVTFNELVAKYTSEFPFFKGAVFYDSIRDSWKDELKTIIMKNFES